MIFKVFEKPESFYMHSMEAITLENNLFQDHILINPFQEVSMQDVKIGQVRRPEVGSTVVGFPIRKNEIIGF